jgi:hypothetical protein
MFDGQAFGREIVETVNAHTAALDERITALEHRPNFDVLSFSRELSVALEAAFKKRDDKIEQLESRITEMEKHAAEFKYRGVWRDGEQYRKNNFVTHDGSVWICLRDTEGKPGQSLEWQLAVRKGRDGRDGKAAA